MRYSLKLRDWLKAALMAILTPVLYVLQTSLENGSLTLNWKQIAIAGASGFVAYLIKNFFTDDLKVANKVISEKIESVKKDNEEVQAIDTSKG